jgi:hypothetical protein
MSQFYVASNSISIAFSTVASSSSLSPNPILAALFLIHHLQRSPQTSPLIWAYGLHRFIIALMGVSTPANVNHIYSDSRLIKGRHNGGLIYFGSSYKHCQHDLADH